MNAKHISDYIYLAEASYTEFSKKEEEYYSLKDLNNGNKPESFAKLVTDNYTVEAHREDKAGSDGSGFSGTLFKGTAESGQAGKYVLTLKSTKGVKDLVIVDGFDIVYDRFALKQSIDLMNFR